MKNQKEKIVDSKLSVHIEELEIMERIELAETIFMFKCSKAQRKSLLKSLKLVLNKGLKTYESPNQLRIIDFNELKKHPINRPIDVINLINIMKNKILEQGHIPYEIYIDENYRVAIHQHLAIVRYLLGIDINFTMVNNIQPIHIYGETSKLNQPINIINVLEKTDTKMAFLSEVLTKYKERAKNYTKFGNATPNHVVGALLNNPKYVGSLGKIDETYKLFDNFPDFDKRSEKKMYAYLDVITYMKKNDGHKKYIGKFHNFATTLLSCVWRNDKFSSEYFISKFEHQRTKKSTYSIVDGNDFQINMQICNTHNFDLRNNKNKIT